MGQELVESNRTQLRRKIRNVSSDGSVIVNDLGHGKGSCSRGDEDLRKPGKGEESVGSKRLHVTVAGSPPGTEKVKISVVVETDHEPTRELRLIDASCLVNRYLSNSKDRH